MTLANYQYRSDFARRYFNAGKTEGKTEGKALGEAWGEARAILTVLATRGIAVSESGQTCITECADLEQLDRWLQRAVTASSEDELFK